MQLSFTLPVPFGDEAREAARQLALKMGLESPAVVAASDLGAGFTFFVVYGRCTHAVDYAAIRIPKQQHRVMTFKEINTMIREKLGYKVVVSRLHRQRCPHCQDRCHC